MVYEAEKNHRCLTLDIRKLEYSGSSKFWREYFDGWGVEKNLLRSFNKYEWASLSYKLIKWIPC
jgi:hypothetical protein